MLGPLLSVCVKEREVGRLVEVSEKGRKGEERTTWRLGGRGQRGCEIVRDTDTREIDTLDIYTRYLH